MTARDFTPEGQKFLMGQLVRLKRPWSDKPAGGVYLCRGSYSQIYGRNRQGDDTKIYSLSVQNGGGFAWVPEESLEVYEVRQD